LVRELVQVSLFVRLAAATIAHFIAVCISSVLIPLCVKIAWCDCCWLCTGGNGYVDVEESTSGILKVLEDGRPLNGRWYAFSGDEIPW
jgi:hypothetical protein